MCEVSLGANRGEARAMLESKTIELRGAVRATLPIANLRSPQVCGDALEAHTDHGPLRLLLGMKEAGVWLDRILHPPTLTAKLGVKPGTRVHIVESHPEMLTVLSAAGAALVGLSEAALVFVAVETATQARALAALVPRLPSGAHLWVLRRKGASVEIKESAIIAALKGAGLAPSKTAGWSTEFTADRYGVARR